VIRAFIAAELPEPCRQEVAAFQSKLQRSGADVKWVETGNLHLTLKFLGEIDDNRVEPLKESLAGLRSRSPFQIHLEGIGAFPKTTYPKVIWVGVNEGKEKLAELAQAVEKICSGLGFPPEERPFSPHLTIGRVRSQEQLAPLIKQLQTAEFRAKTPAEIGKLTLFQSTLGPRGPVYRPLAEIPLTPG